MFDFFFSTGTRRRPEGLTGHLAKAFAAGSAIWVVYAAGFSRADSLTLTMTFLALMLVLTFLLIGPSPTSAKTRVNLIDWVLAALSVAVGTYFVTQADLISMRITLLDPLDTADVISASVILLLAIEAMRRTVGMGLTLIVLLFLAYNLWGDRLGGVLGHGEISYVHFLDITVFTTDGLFGVPLRVAATYAFLFVLFGTALSKAGGAQFFYNLAAYLTGGTVGGPAKIAVVSSGLYGTISGSPTSDVVTTGSVTIPMMKTMGYRPAFAAATEVAASTGGSLLPPVMGAAAFIMAEYTGIPYAEIALAALIPALLYYVPIYLQVHLRALREGLRGVDLSTIPSLGRIIKDGGLFVVPLVVISWALIKGYTPTYSALYGLAGVLGVSMLRRATRMGIADIYDVLAETSFRMVAVAGACAAAGLVIGGITMTGLASKFSTLVFMISGADVLASLIIAALLTTLLGMGMPTPSAYILAAVLISPVMQDLGIDLLAGHLFILYFAVMSALTPPVAVAAYAASAIADENPLVIAVQAVKIALGAFLIPFAFVYQPALLLKGSVVEILVAVIGAVAGLSLVAVAAEGYYRTPLGRGPRLALTAAGLLLLFGGLLSWLGALVLAGCAWVWSKAQERAPEAKGATGE
ncbi:TRAP transporter permease [Sedimentitalea todarodis]|uniref:TRAP transporter fused permease subunit n=1 Tax=Sedimentitalea todarodis TaxID=1631240 RepID=A0ABU3VHQ1_9RHOB|nr:TRAP transporter fused permease subunit [Sedimentitalea todarodis]MDU9005623.1 TRAP transporter fused permease subunit [Sedimentitalea todarodis]